MASLRRYRMVIALDGSEYSEIVIEHALDQAARHEFSDLHVLSVIADDADASTTASWLSQAVLEGLDAFRAGRDWRIRLHVRRGEPADEIATLAAEIDADLIVIGRFGTNDPRRSIAGDVVTNAICPTLVVGLTGHEVEAEPPCPACMATRDESDGERWFCADHSAPDRMRLSTLLPWSGQLVHGGPLW